MTNIIVAARNTASIHHAFYVTLYLATVSASLCDVTACLIAVLATTVTRKDVRSSFRLSRSSLYVNESMVTYRVAVYLYSYVAAPGEHVRNSNNKPPCCRKQ